MNYTPILFKEKSKFEVLIERLKMCCHVLNDKKVMVIVKQEKSFEINSVNFTKADHNSFVNSAFDNLLTEKCKGRVSEILGYDIQ